MAASGGGLTSSSTAAGFGTQAPPAKARFPGRPCTTRSKLRSEKRTRRGRLGFDHGDVAAGGPRPVNIGLALSEDPSLLRLLGVVEKHMRQRDVGFDSSNSEEEEDFSGFGATRVHQRKTVAALRRGQAKPPPASEHLPGAKAGLRKVIPKTPKPGLIGKIVPRLPKDGQDGKESQVNRRETPKAASEDDDEQEALTEGAGHAGSQPCTTPAGGDTAGPARSGSKQNQKVSMKLKASGGTEETRGTILEGNKSLKEPDSNATLKAVKRTGAFRGGHSSRTSRAVALSFTSFSKRRRRRMGKGMGASPEAGAEAGTPRGEEAAMPLDSTAETSGKRQKRGSLFGYRKPPIEMPGPAQVHTRRVFSTHVSEAPPTSQPEENQLQILMKKSQDDPKLAAEQMQQSSTTSSTTVTSGRSSRVIKTPKRFLDEEMIPFPKGSLSTWLKSQQRDEGKPSESQYERHDSEAFLDSSSSVSKISSVSPGASHVEIYKNLKKLTLKLAEKKRGHSDSPEDFPDHDDHLNSYVRKKQRPKITMEELDSPGVVRKLAVVVNAGAEAPPPDPAEGSTIEGKHASGDRSEAVEVSGPSYRIGLSGANRRMLHLLKKAKVQLIKIDQQKQLKLSQLSSCETQVPVSGRRRRRRRRRAGGEAAPQEQPLGGPRIKHVCRAAAVALGQPRAMVPDDIPRLSALPLHEREGITFSPATEDVADDDDLFDQSRAQWVVSQESIQRKRRLGRRFKRRKILSQYIPGGIRSRRCGVCQGCQVLEDCGRCVNCLDKPKFGGPNTKRQCCIYRRCDRIEEAKLHRNGKSLKVRPRSDSWSDSLKPSTGLVIRKRSLRKIKRRSFSNLLKSESDEEKEEQSNAAASSNQDGSLQSGVPLLDEQAEAGKHRRLLCRFPGSKQKAYKTPAECASVNTLTGLSNGFNQKGLLQNKLKIRVDFKEDCGVQNVWLMGGLSVLASVPTTPQPVCLLCASKGRHEMIFCQICCEPFHSFCLTPEECPQEDSKENWCCRRCKFCHVCGRRSKSAKPVLQCRRCQTCYHPSCLGPTYPKPVNCDLPWVCMTCIRCKSCGVTPGKTWDLAWNHEEDLCPECSVLNKKGHFCTVCHKCYEDPPLHMIQCSDCKHWIHPKCEGLSEELFGLLSTQPDSAFSCSPCRGAEDSSLKTGLQAKLLAGLEEVLTDLLSSSSTQHLLLCEACVEAAGVEREQKSICDLHAVQHKLKGGGYTSIKAFHADVAAVMRRRLKEEELLPEDQRPTPQARAHYIQVMKRVFSWFPACYFKKWSSFSEEFPSGMLPDAVLPPSQEHSYAQWLERTYQAREARAPQGDGVLPAVRAWQPGSPHVLPLYQQESMKTGDVRHCVLCQQYGDSPTADAGRLLYLGQNEWAHVNCCLWSAEVYEQNGALLQVHSAVSRGRHLRCDRCGQSGATVGCCLATCQSNFHFMCARAENCVFQEDRKVYCCMHRELVSTKVVSGAGFEVRRRAYVDFEGINLRRKFLTGLEPETITMTIGSLQIQKLGVLSELSSNGRMLYPVGYQCSRLYWSTVDPRRRCKYTCKVTEVSTPLPGEEQDLRWDREQNHTIVHSPCQDFTDMPSPECLSSSPSPLKSTTPSPNAKVSTTPGPRSPGYSHTRRPAGGSSRPLPSPGSAPQKPHPILTLRDLEDTRRPRRLSSRSRCSSSPTESDPPVPMSLRPAAPPRCSLFNSPPRLSTVGAASPPLSRQNSLSPVWSSPPRSGSSLPAGQAALAHSPRGRQNFKITTPVSAEVPQDFLASSETEDAAVATTNGISLSPDNLEEEVAQLMSQELPCTVFDTDTEVAVASMLNAKLEFDDTFLSENVALNCGTPGARGEAADGGLQKELGAGGSEDEDSARYLKFSRTVVCDAAGGSGSSAPAPAAPSISQLDGADSGSEDDDGEGSDEQVRSPACRNTPTKKLTIALKRLESIFSSSKPSTVPQTEAELQEGSSSPDLLESGLSHSELTLHNEEVSSQNDLILSSETGHFVSSEEVSTERPRAGADPEKDNDSSSGESVGGFQDDVNDPDYSPQPLTKKSPIKTFSVKARPPLAPAPAVGLPRDCFRPKLILPLPRRPEPALASRPASSPAAAFCSVPRPVTSPIVINGLNTLPVQAKTIAVRLENAKPQAQFPPNPAANSAAPQAPARQVLLVNRHGQILVKDPRSNTFQQLPASSPSYQRISSIAKILHRDGGVQASVPRVILKTGPSQPAVTVAAAPNHGTAEKKIIYRMVPIKSAPTPAAPLAAQTLLQPASSALRDGAARVIINRTAVSHGDAARPKPIILSSTPQLTSRILLSPRTAPAEDSPEPSGDDGGRQQARVKRVSSMTERASRKKARMDFLKDPEDSEEPQESRTGGIRMKAPTTKEVLNLDQEKKSGSLKTPAPPSPCRVSRAESSPAAEPSSAQPQVKTHTWISARHGDLSEWGPCTGFSSEEDAPASKHRKTYMNQPHLRFEITSEDGFSVKANSIEVAWRAVVDGVFEARAAFHLKQLPLGVMSGPRVLGVVHDAVLFLLEQLQGAADCKRHRFRFHHCDRVEEELPVNPSGCARAEVYSRKATFDMFNFLASQHRELPDFIGPFEEDDDEFPLKASRRATSTELPMAMRFRHLEKTSKEAVGVYRSLIHGRGLFCKRNIEAGEMVIEYAGTVIRAVLTDKREKFYDGKGIGCYMFRIDDFDVVDATMQGNAARFINHSCEPNCYSRVINVDGRKHIVIFALRKIYRGEELTYDYKFPIEDEDNKLHCNCGTRRCRRFLN
ncbi:Histone-lysine N-methyltransferase 2B [Oryzias melastigma]|uniref:[histone H3]-lysine(4) N-methyltransferase n=1 Tax=Oryzias melastigma TaxID=30732 RepID=A0A834C9A1_ORYME|nr:Histone-lysine N-methyltransferase 2B [Oryzias melastigma]